MELLKALALWFAALGAALVLLFAIDPRMLTGSYADITVDHISVDKNGQYTVSILEGVAARTSVIEGFYSGNKYGGGGSGGNSGYLGWPNSGSSVVDFMLDPEDIAAGHSSGPRRDRLLVHEGEKRRLHPGERLYFYDFTLPDGTRYYGFVEGQNYRDRPRMIRAFPFWPF